MIQFNEDKQTETLDKLHSHEEERFVKRLAAQSGLEFIDLGLVSIQGDALRLVPKETSQEAELIPFAILNDTLSVAMRKPDSEATRNVLADLKEKGYTVQPFLTTTDSLKKGWQTYDDLSASFKTRRGTVDISNENIDTIRENVKTIQDVAKLVTDTLKKDTMSKTSELTENILGGALAVGASDIHIEPEEEAVRLRYRLDGVLQKIADIDYATYKSLMSRLKLVSGMKLNIASEAQDGRFSIDAGDTEIQIRSSVIPSPGGDSIVMRILDPSSIQVELKDLGIPDDLLVIFRREISKPNGMLLNTGPTGSGKTTTLYSFLREVNSPDVKILTIENPVEYHLEGVVQTQVDHDAGYDFLAGLRSAMRQDPDIIMVGEIRDEETANTAINAALTGHLVFSTLHTNDAAGTFPRLIDLGVDAKVITSAVTLSMAQRLVRKLCENCKKEAPIEGKDRETVDALLTSLGEKNEKYLTDLQTEKMWVPEGCDECNGLGYKGRLGIYEAILGDKAIEMVLRENPSIREIWEAAKPQGIPKLAEDGVVKALQGITSLEELRRVVDIDSHDAG
ncbi:MAG: GspE/PulE family protein [Candidatus Paceibacterota bacterium]